MQSLFKFVLLTVLIVEICCVLRVIQSSDNNDADILDLDLNNTISSVNVSIPKLNTKNSLKIVNGNSVITRKRRRRRRRKKKIQPVLQNATVPTIISENKTYDVNENFLSITTVTPKTKTKRRRLKARRRRLGRRKQNKQLELTSLNTTTDTLYLKNDITNTSPISSSELKTRSLILPAAPSSELSVRNKTGKVKVKKMKMKNSRCRKNNGGCAHLCLLKGPQKCQCFKGFRLADDKRNCIDINECVSNTHSCQMNCTNTIGSYRCHCARGLRLSLNSKSCVDVNECLLRNGHGPCQDTCQNTYGGYRCSCDSLMGTRLSNDFHSCVDEDECSKENGGCSHICINTFGQSFCSCPEGMELSFDFRTCQDVYPDFDSEI